MHSTKEDNIKKRITIINAEIKNHEMDRSRHEHKIVTINTFISNLRKEKSNLELENTTEPPTEEIVIKPTRPKKKLKLGLDDLEDKNNQYIGLRRDDDPIHTDEEEYPHSKFPREEECTFVSMVNDINNY